VVAGTAAVVTAEAAERTSSRAFDPAHSTEAAGTAAAVQLTRCSLDEGGGTHNAVERRRLKGCTGVVPQHVLARLACLLCLQLHASFC
jgi:hypothetical protein